MKGPEIEIKNIRPECSSGKRKQNLYLSIFIFYIGIIIFNFFPAPLSGQPLFIYRPAQEKQPLLSSGRLDPRGELFALLLLPSNFPSFNDFNGSEDRWNLGFQLYLDLTPSTEFLSQLITHDDGHNRTKFDWHFSLRQQIDRYLVLIVGHDSNHDSDHQSFVNGKPFYLNRNYLGFGLCFSFKQFYFEPFTWFFHHTNQRFYLDFSGEKLKQEYGARLGFLLSPEASLSFQAIFQSDVAFARGQMALIDFFMRLRLLSWLELSLGGSFWRDLKESRFGRRQSFYKFSWGIAIPF